MPPLAEQRRVVARIEELAAQIHEARTLRHQAAEEAEALSGQARKHILKACGQMNKTNSGCSNTSTRYKPPRRSDFYARAIQWATFGDLEYREEARNMSKS